MTAIARFEHVSQAQYQRDCPLDDRLPLSALPLPRRATAGSAGYDFVSPVTLTLAPGCAALVPTGVRVRMARGWVLLMFPRSSLGMKYRLRLSNTVGVIDSDYYGAQNEGHILIGLENGGDAPVTIHQGERFCQGVLLPCGVAEEDEAAGIRTGGFGSTGTNA